MRPYAVIDFHCDTLTDYMYDPRAESDTLNDPHRALSLSNIPPDVHWAQCFGIFIPDTLRGKAAVEYYEKNVRSFTRQMKKYSSCVQPARSLSDIHAAWQDNKIAGLLTVEGGAVLAGEISRVETLRRDGVQMLTLVWNGENELGSGNLTEKGLTDFGKDVISEMERNNIIADVSHLNDRGFAELLKIAKKPFAASHSNCRAVCRHPRNLPDEFIVEMVRRRCFIGLNFYTAFLTDGGKTNGVGDFIKHIEHFRKLGAEKNIGLGSDFDGAETPDYLASPAKVAALYETLVNAGIERECVDDMMYKNAERFLERVTDR